jgi:hypothetical protein
MAPFDVSAPAAPVPAELGAELEPGERLLWSGRPAGGVRLQGSDAAVSVFALLWCAIAAGWWGSASEVDEGGLAALALVPVTLVGLYLLVGRFFHDAWRRSRTLHAVTSRRILTVVAAPRRTVSAFPLAALPEPSLVAHRSGLGTITFPSQPDPHLPFEDSDQPPVTAPAAGPRLAFLPDAPRALEAICAARRLAATPAAAPG